MTVTGRFPSSGTGRCGSLALKGSAHAKPVLTRRWTFATLAVGVGVAFPSRGEAQHPVGVDVNVAPYAGRTSGRLPADGRPGSSGPVVGTTFGGFGARLRVRRLEATGDRTRGLVLAAQGAVEQQSHDLLADGSGGQEQIPPDQLMAAGSVTIGYEWRLVGFHVGVGGREVVGSPLVARFYNLCARCYQPTYPSTRVSFYPELRLRVGLSDGLYGDASLGAYTPGMALRPGLQVGLGYAARAGHGVALRYGVQSVVGTSFGQRFDLAGSWALNERIAVGLGVAVVHSNTRVDLDGRATVTLRFGR